MTATGRKPLDGHAAAQAISAAIAAFPPEISYVRAQVLPAGPVLLAPRVPAEGDWVPCGELCADPAWLGEVVRASGRQLGTDDDMVAASLFVQNYAYRVMMVAVACTTVGAVVPGSRATDMAITMSRGRPHVVGYTVPRALSVAGDRPRGGSQTAPLTPAAMRLALEHLVDEVVDAHLGRLIDATRSRFRIGYRLLWGNVASSTATAFRTMDGCLGSWVRPMGEEFLRVAPELLQGHGSFLALEHEGRSGWFWERTNCCLYDRLPGKARCGDCSRAPKAQRRAGYEASLAGEPRPLNLSSGPAKGLLERPKPRFSS